MRKVVTHREQAEMFAPWREDATKGWYHATPHNLPVGTMLTPHAVSPTSGGIYENPQFEGHADSIWLSNTLEEGEKMRESTGPHLYRVEPTEEPQANTGAWTTPSAKIVEKIPRWDD